MLHVAAEVGQENRKNYCLGSFGRIRRGLIELKIMSEGSCFSYKIYKLPNVTLGFFFFFFGNGNGKKKSTS